MKKLKHLLLSSFITLVPLNSYGVVGKTMLESEFIYIARVSSRYERNTSYSTSAYTYGNAVILVKEVETRINTKKIEYWIEVGKLNIDLKVAGNIITSEYFTKLDKSDFTEYEIKRILSFHVAGEWKTQTSNEYIMSMKNDKFEVIIMKNSVHIELTPPTKTNQ